MFDAAWLEIPDFAIRIAAPVAFGTSYISITYKKTHPVFKFGLCLRLGSLRLLGSVLPLVELLHNGIVGAL